MAEIEITTPKIKTYNDFVKQLQEITKQDSDIVLSFYKYCWTRNHNSKDFKELMIQELEPFGLKPFVRKFTEDMNIVFRILKISPNKNGYVYWLDAVFLNIITEKPHVSICKDIYSVIAMKYGTSQMAVERAMRLCFENTMYNLAKDDNYIVSYFKNSLVFPHNSEILSKMTELLISKDFQQRKHKL